MAIKIIMCIAAIVVILASLNVTIKCFSKERKYLKLVNKTLKIIEFFVPNYKLTSYTTNVVVEDKTLLFQIFPEHIVIYCKETGQTYLIDSKDDKEIKSSLEDIRNEIFKHS